MEAAACRVVLVGRRIPQRRLRRAGDAVVSARRRWSSSPLLEIHSSGSPQDRSRRAGNPGRGPFSSPKLAAPCAAARPRSPSAAARTTLRQSRIRPARRARRSGRFGRTALVFGANRTGSRARNRAVPALGRASLAEEASASIFGQAVAVALFSLTAPAPRRDTRSEKVPPRRRGDRLLGLWDFLEPKLSAAPRFTAARLPAHPADVLPSQPRRPRKTSDLLFAVMSELARPAAVRRASKS